MDGLGTGEMGRDAFAHFEDVAGEKTMEDWEEGSIAVEDGMGTWVYGLRRALDGGDESGENCSEA